MTFNETTYKNTKTNNKHNHIFNEQMINTHDMFNTNLTNNYTQSFKHIKTTTQHNTTQHNKHNNG